MENLNLNNQRYWNRRFPITGFWQMRALHGKLVFAIKWRHEGARSLVEKFEVVEIANLLFQ